MVHLITAKNRHAYQPGIAEMHRDRKRVFIDQLKWNLPHSDGMEIDQFDDFCAEYLLVSDALTHEHFGSMRLLQTDRPHILGDLFPFLCKESVPCGHDIREITRLCLSRRLKCAQRQVVFHRLVTALVEYALLTDITAYTAVTSIHWLSQTLALGWRCTPLGLPQVIEGEPAAAVMIHIDQNTIELLRQAGTYQTTNLQLEEFDLAAAA